MNTLMQYARKQLEHVSRTLADALTERDNLNVQIEGLSIQKADLENYISNLDKQDDKQNALALAATILEAR